MSDKESQQKAANNVTDSERPLDWAPNSHDIGIQRLKEERNRITYGVKYADRYKSFLEPISPTANSTKIEMDPKCPSNSPNIKPNTGSPNFIQKHTFKPQSNPTSPKFNHKNSPSFAKKQTMSPNFPNKIGFKDKERGRNATHDLNNSKNISQLASYRIISASNQATPKPVDYTEQNYFTVPNPESYAVTFRNKIKDDPKTDTLYTLENIQAYITECEEQQKLKKIAPDFPTNMTRPRTEENILSCRESSPKIDSKDMNHIQEPLKSFNEVENLLKPGVSDLEAEHREIKGRHSSTNEEYNKRTPSHKHVLRTVSDARYKPAKVFEKQLQNPRPRKITKVFFCSLFY